MSKQAQLYLLFIIHVLFSSLVGAREAERLPDRPQSDPISAAIHVQRAAARAARLRDQQLARIFQATLAEIERFYLLPPGTFGPAYLSRPSQRSGVTSLLQHRSTKMFPLLTSSADGHILFASPVLSSRANGERGFRKYLLVFRLYPSEGKIVPLGYTRVSPEVQEGDDVNFMDLVLHRARASWESLRHEYGDLRVADPHQLL